MSSYDNLCPCCGEIECNQMNMTEGDKITEQNRAFDIAECVGTSYARHRPMTDREACEAMDALYPGWYAAWCEREGTMQELRQELFDSGVEV